MNLRLSSFSHFRKLFTTILLAVLCYSLAIGQQAPILLQDQRELFGGDYLLATVENTEARFATPVPQGAVIEFPEAWEGKSCAYVCIFSSTS